jgi:hypothetical protein
MAFTHTTNEKTKSKTIIRQDGTEIRIDNGNVTINGKEATLGNGKTIVDGKEIRVEGNKVFINGKEVTGAVMVAQPNVVVKTIEDGDGTRREEIRVQVIRNGDEKITTIPIPPIPPVPPVAAVPPVPPLPPMPGIQTLRFESTARLGKGVTTQLGTKDFDGVKAEGKSTVWTIAAGEIGNRNPINITSESWYSPDLKVTVYSRYSDPRTGESLYRLANIRRAEPVAALFTVPSDYTEKGRKEIREKDKK